MPSVSVQFVVTDETIELANASWKFAMSGDSPPYLAAKAKEPSLTPLVFFYNQSDSHAAQHGALRGR